MCSLPRNLTAPAPAAVGVNSNAGRRSPTPQPFQALLHHVELYVSDLERSIAFWTPFMALLGYGADRWPGGMNYVRGQDETYVCLLQAEKSHLAAGYHRKRVGLNHLAFQGSSRQQVDAIANWAKANGYTLLYEDKHPYAGGPTYYAVFLEDPDRFKLEVVAPPGKA